MQKIKRFPIILKKNEKLLSIIFFSEDKKMNYSMICKNTDIICDLEKKLNKEYPDFAYSDNNIFCKGKAINRFQTIESNKIKNGDVLTLSQKMD